MGTPVNVANFQELAKTTLPVDATNLQRESFTGFHPVIQSDHTYIHDGLGYNYPCTFSLGNVEIKGCVIKPPAANVAYIHWRPVTVSTSASAIRVELFESPTYSGGAALTGVINKNRNSTNTAASVLWDGALTITDNGLRLTIAQHGLGGQPANRAGGTGGDANEIVFKPGLEYLLLFTNLTSTTTTVAANLFWYEETMG